MTLHPEVQNLIAQLAEMDAPAAPDKSVEDARAFLKAGAALLAQKDVPVGKVEDDTIPGPAGDIPIRIYTPIAAPRGVPAALFFHGGGFVVGDIDTHDSVARVLARESGCKIISVDYRLAPEHPFPAAIEDALAATEWVAKHAADLDIDPNALGVAGDSAGGNIAAVICQQKSSKLSIAFQLLIYPVMQVDAATPSHAEFADGALLSRADFDWYINHYVPAGADHQDPRLSPLCAEDVSGLPPAYILTADHDILRDEGRLYAERLLEAGVEVTYANYDGMVHGFVSTGGLLEDGRRALAAAGAALGAGLRD